MAIQTELRSEMEEKIKRNIRIVRHWQTAKKRGYIDTDYADRIINRYMDEYLFIRNTLCEIDSLPVTIETNREY